MVDRSLFYFNSPDVPPNVMELRTWQTAKRIGHGRCFYTGLECRFSIGEPGAWGATLEHLVSEISGGHRTPQNTVIACGLANSTIGSAPIPVKMEVRDAFRSNPVSGYTRREIKDVILKTMQKYKVARPDGKALQYVWLSDIEDPEQLIKAEPILKYLLKLEEQYLQNPIGAFEEN